jgi:hypothetical protein
LTATQFATPDSILPAAIGFFDDDRTLANPRHAVKKKFLPRS